MPSINQFIAFQKKIGVLKHLPRTGWVIYQVPKAETVAAHSWRMALMAFQKENELKTPQINTDKVIEMCLLHDVAEAVVGDIVPLEEQRTLKKITKEEKNKLETEVINTFSAQYNFPKLKTLFDEYEAQNTMESRIVKNLDKIDMLLQAYEYLQAYPQLTELDKFMQHNEKAVNLPLFQKELKEIKARQYQNQISPNNFLDFQIQAGKLKHLKHNTSIVTQSETVADHVFGTAVMALHLEENLKEQGLNTIQIVKNILANGISKKITSDKAIKFQKQTSENILAKDLDILETLLQAYNCTQTKQLSKSVSVLYGKIKSPLILKIANEIIK